MRKQDSHVITKASLIWLLAISVINWGSAKLFLIPAFAWQQQESVSSQAHQDEKSVKPKENEDQAEAIEREIQQALQSLYQASVTAKDLPDPIFRIRSYTAIAEAVWEHDRSVAANLFRTAFEETTKVSKPERPRGSPPSMGGSRSPEELRQEVITRVSKHDPALAIELSKSIEPESKNETSAGVPTHSTGPTRNPARAGALMNLANSLLEKDPKNAIEAAAATLTDGVTLSLVSFIGKLSEKDQALADALYNQALRAPFRNIPPSVQELLFLGPYALPGIPLPMSISTGNEPKAIQPARAAQYLSALVEASSLHVERILNPSIATATPPTDGFSNPAGLYNLLTTIRPAVMQYIPERASTVDTLLGQLSPRVSQRTREDIQTSESKREQTPEEKISDYLNRADQAKTADERDTLLFRALHQAVQVDKLDAALEIIPKINDLTLRGEASDYVHFRRVKKALENNEVETARRSAAELNNAERITLAHIAIAKKLAEQKENESALVTLVGAEVKIKRLPTSTEKARSLLQIAAALAPLDPERAFEVLGAAVVALNQSETAIEGPTAANFSFRLRGFGTGWKIAEENLVPMLEGLIKTLTKADPFRAQSAALSLEKPPLRILAQIAFARSQLEQAKEKKAKLTKTKSAS
jgi:hypothetical protein